MSFAAPRRFSRETPPGKNQNLFATLTVRTYVWIVPLNGINTSEGAHFHIQNTPGAYHETEHIRDL